MLSSHRKSLEGDWKGMTRLITDEMLDTIAVSGTYESIGTKLRERYAGLLDRIALYQPYETLVDDSRLTHVRGRIASQVRVFSGIW